MKIGSLFLITIHCAFSCAEVESYKEWIHTAAQLAFNQPGDTFKNYEENLEEMVRKNLIWESRDIQKEVNNIVQDYRNCLMKKEYDDINELKTIVNKQYEEAKCHYQPSSYFRDLINLEVYSKKMFSKLHNKQTLYAYIAEKNKNFKHEKLKGKEIIKFFEFHFENALELSKKTVSVFEEKKFSVNVELFRAYVNEHIKKSHYFQVVHSYQELYEDWNQLNEAYVSLIAIWNEGEIASKPGHSKPRNSWQNYRQIFPVKQEKSKSKSKITESEKEMPPLIRLTDLKKTEHDFRSNNVLKDKMPPPAMNKQSCLQKIQNYYTQEEGNDSLDVLLKELNEIKRSEGKNKINDREIRKNKEQNLGDQEISKEWQRRIKENLENLEKNRMRPAQPRKGIFNKNSFFSNGYIQKFYRN